MARVFLTEPAEAILTGLEPADREGVGWAVSCLENDGLRETSKIDLARVEDGMKVWAFAPGNVWLAFVEPPDGSIMVTHLSVLSRFRAAPSEQ